MLMYQRRTAGIRCFFIITLFASAVLFLCYRFCVVTSSVSEVNAKYIATMAVNEITSRYLSECSDAYKDIVVSNHDSYGNISAISTDIVKINQLQSEIASQVLETLGNRSSSQIKIPIMNIIGMQTLTGWGPTVDMNIMPAPNVIVKFEDSFTAAGINQTQFSVKLHIEIDMMVKTTAFKNTVRVSHEVPVVQMVLVGNVPNAYANIHR